MPKMCAFGAGREESSGDLSSASARLLSRKGRWLETLCNILFTYTVYYSAQKFDRVKHPSVNAHAQTPLVHHQIWCKLSCTSRSVFFCYSSQLGVLEE